MNRREFMAGSVASVALTSTGTRCSSRDRADASISDENRPPIVIDAHAHVGYMGMFGQKDVSFEESLSAADEAGIDKVCVSSLLEAIEFDAKEGNKAIYQLMKRYPDRVIGFATVCTPYFGQKGLDEIQRAIEVYGMKGVGELETNAGDPPDIPQWIAILEKAASLKVPVLLHSAPGPCARAADRVPEATIILAHLGTGLGTAVGEWFDAVEMAKTHPNVYLETCSSMTVLGQIEKVVQELGAERIVFGTDSPLLDPAVQKAKITGADISDEAKERLLGLNMAHLLNI